MQRAMHGLVMMVMLTARVVWAQCPGNVIEMADDAVNGADLAQVLSLWGPCSACPEDLTGDGQVNGADIAIVLSAWGPCPAGLDSVEPASGSYRGGTTVYLYGERLLSTTAVTFGGIPAASFEVLTQSTIRVVTPPAPFGPATIAVTTAAGDAQLKAGFEFEPPSVGTVSPSTVSVLGGASITIFGSHLDEATGIRVGGVPCTGFVRVSSGELRALVPAGSPATVDVQVEHPLASLVLGQALTYGSGSVPAWAELVEAEPDPQVVTSAALRSAITATGLAWRVRDAGTQVEMLLVPPGTFVMGCSSGDGNCQSNESPAHQVTITSPFYLARRELTQDQWVAVMGYNPSDFGGWLYPGSGNRPVEKVSWDMAQQFMSATGMRLPTEAEWELACRAGTSTPTYLAGVQIGQLAWMGTNNGSPGAATWGTKQVGQLLPNALGLHDMLGNVWEWCQDRGGAYSAAAQTNPTGPATGGTRVLRGGNWFNIAPVVRCSVRFDTVPGDVDIIGAGVRPARTP
jgi:formylglycine-generating enzyme required for sulfatase activity